MTNDDTDLPVDFVVAAYREEGRWQVELLPPVLAEDLDSLVAVLRQRPADAGALGMVSMDDDFFVLVRVQGQRVQLFLSDVTAAQDWPLASDVLDTLDLPWPDDDERVQPAGEVDILAELGLSPFTLAAMCDDIDAYPDETLTSIAGHLGFGEEFQALIADVEA